MSILDAYQSYHQIAIHELDQENIAFITPRDIFCYRVMPFGLKNVGATYQRMITKMFGHLMMVKIKEERNHMRDLAEVLKILKKHKLKLNMNK